jgi:hypothetical protein
VRISPRARGDRPTNVATHRVSRREDQTRVLVGQRDDARADGGRHSLAGAGFRTRRIERGVGDQDAIRDRRGLVRREFPPADQPLRPRGVPLGDCHDRGAEVHRRVRLARQVLDE